MGAAAFAIVRHSPALTLTSFRPSEHREREPESIITELKALALPRNICDGGGYGFRVHRFAVPRNDSVPNQVIFSGIGLAPCRLTLGACPGTGLPRTCASLVKNGAERLHRSGGASGRVWC
jgi:hypothetical protein